MASAVVVALAVAPAVACGDATAPQTGSFDAFVSGAEQGQVSGVSAFGRADGDFVIELFSGAAETTTTIRFRSAGADRPGPGTYPIMSPPDSAAFSVTFLQTEGFETTADMAAGTGTIMIESSSEERLRGEFEFVAVGFLIVDGSPIGDAEIQVTGSFEATASN